MSEPLAERLSRFTPDGSGLDRDALLFAAGRASVRPNRRWQTLAAVLAASQLLTLVCLWPPTPAPPAPPVVVESRPLDVSPEEPAPAPGGEWTPRTALLSLDLDRSEPPSDEPMVPPEPPLRAFGPPPETILN
jgi:hypothetical protein